MKRTPEKDVDEMRRLLRKSGWCFTSAGWRHYDDKDDFASDAEGRGRTKGIEEGRRQAASEVLNALGLTDQYPDVTEERSGIREAKSTSPFDFGWGGGFVESYTYTVVIPGADLFLDDIATVAKSRDVNDARKRLGLTGKK